MVTDFEKWLQGSQWWERLLSRDCILMAQEAWNAAGASNTSQLPVCTCGDKYEPNQLDSTCPIHGNTRKGEMDKLDVFARQTVDELPLYFGLRREAAAQIIKAAFIKLLDATILHLSGKATDNIWLMEDEHGIGIRIRVGSGDAGTVYVTPAQAKMLGEELLRFVRTEAK